MPRFRLVVFGCLALAVLSVLTRARLRRFVASAIFNVNQLDYDDFNQPRTSISSAHKLVISILRSENKIEGVPEDKDIYLLTHRDPNWIRVKFKSNDRLMTYFLNDEFTPVASYFEEPRYYGLPLISPLLMGNDCALVLIAYRPYKLKYDQSRYFWWIVYFTPEKNYFIGLVVFPYSRFGDSTFGVFPRWMTMDNDRIELQIWRPSAEETDLRRFLDSTPIQRAFFRFNIRTMTLLDEENLLSDHIEFHLMQSQIELNDNEAINPQFEKILAGLKLQD